MSTLEFEQQLTGIRQQLYYFALRLTHDHDDASDLVQESSLRALTYREKFQPGTNFRAWLHTIMKNTFINAHRRTKRTTAYVDSMERHLAQVRQLRSSQGLEDRIISKEIKVAIEHLDPMFRVPFLMHHEGFKYHEIAEHIGVPVGTVKSRIHQARHRLKEMLAELDPAA